MSGITIPSNRFHQFCAVEIKPSLPYSPLMGNRETARWFVGDVTEEIIANHGFLRMDLPACEKYPARTILIDPAHVRRIEPLSEEQMLAALSIILGRSRQKHTPDLVIDEPDK